MQLKMKRIKVNYHVLFIQASMVVFLLGGCASSGEEENEIELSKKPNAEDEGATERSVDEAERLTSHGVSAGHPDAVEAGMKVLESGGNAVDAAIAAAYAISVVEPFASGIGGGGVTLVQEQGEDAEAYDYREVVPEDGIPSSNSGVPGFVAGMMTMHDDYGRSDWQEVLNPAIELAEHATVSETFAEQLQSAQGRLPVERLEHFYPGGTPLSAGDDIEQSELADTLRLIRDRGGESFYEAEIAEGLVSEIEGLNMNSLSDYRVGRHQPVTGEFAGYDVIGAPLPLPGASVIQMLQIIEERGTLNESRNSTDFIHDIAMSWRIAHHTIQTEFDDPSFVDVPIDHLTNAEQNKALAEKISSDRLLSGDELVAHDSDPNTTHITVIDDEGTVVSMTNTLTDFFGSGDYTQGFFLNNQMSRFSIGSEGNNEPEPGKRSITWSSPLILADEKGPVMGIGSPGGERIPIMLTQVIADWVGGEADLEQAVETERFHLTEDELIMEGDVDSNQREALLQKGYQDVREPPTPLYFGSIQALAIDRETGELEGATDHRREGAWRKETTE
ncbi:gamma-glutamyltransferase family protein [Geomicrobium sediminis]|uniref:Gamma-glutamyltranspeptidase/glutathione hydrolase n=1 Tax=Geomicrobium sediminis TaxID=1347788 RepID=A0ABS2PDC7_9BACL|nr:gamma-glutamyltransferase [Geomicrobium sediminis]MBM7633070.1 gamma-glutamyltranspeptidase/glutathione hydrolase [Geomicrobium sediminis]